MAFFNLRKWLRVPEASRAPMGRVRSRSYRPMLEELEVRIVPALGTPTWVPQGPAPIQVTRFSPPPLALGSPQDGAVSGIATDPVNADNVFIATVNGGVWRSTNATMANPTWTALMDQAPSLSTSDVAYALDANGTVDPNTLWVSTGGVSSAFFVGQAIGVYKITQALGANPVVSAPLGQNVFAGVTITRIVAIPVAGANVTGMGAIAVTNQGLFRTVDGGANWNLVLQGAATDVVRDPGVNVAAVTVSNPGAGYQVNTGFVIAGGTYAVPGVTAPAVIVVTSVNPNGGIATAIVVAGGSYSALPAQPAGVDPDPRMPGNGATFNLTPGLTAAGNRLYAAIPGQGVFTSVNAGATWALTAGNAQLAGDVQLNPNNQRIRLALSGNGAVFAGFLSGPIAPPGQMAPPPNITGVWRSLNLGANWTAMDVPADANGRVISDFTLKSAIAADPRNSNIVYVSGTLQPEGAPAQNRGRMPRGDISQPAGAQWALSLGFTGATVTSAPHADTRRIAFDANFNLLESDDGGIYKLTNPNLATRAWATMDGNLQATEFYSVGYDSVNNVIVGGAQDNGTPRQNAQNGGVWNDQTGGDGAMVQVDNSTAGASTEYVAFQNLGGFSRITFSNANPQGDRLPIVVLDNNGQNVVTLATADRTIQFIQPFVLDSVDPTRMLIGTNSIYESTNAVAANGVYSITVAPRTANLGAVRGMAYGGTLNGVANPDVAYVGAVGANSLLLRTAANQAFAPVAAYTGGTPLGIALDPTNWQTAVILDQNGRVWLLTNASLANVACTEITGTLANLVNGANPAVASVVANNVALTDIAVYRNPQDANNLRIFVGGAGGVYGTDNPSAGLTTTWVRFGALPNVLVTALNYNAASNVLVAGTFGRGAFTVANLSNFAGNQAPAQTFNAAAPTFTPGNAAVPVAVAPQLSIAPGASPTLVSATVTINNPQDGANEVLAGNTTGTTITTNYNSATGTLTLSGTDTVGHYQQVLDSVTYDDTASAPNPTPRSITVQVDAPGANSNASTETIGFNAVANGPPLVNTGGPGIPDTTAQFTSLGAAIPLAPNLTLTASVANLTSAQVTITNLQDGAAETLAATIAGTAISASYTPATGVLALTGTDTVAHYQQVLRSVVYNDIKAAPSDFARFITFQVVAGATAGDLATCTVFITLVNNAPVLNNTQAFPLTPIAPNDANPAGQTAFSILASLTPTRITDPDAGAVQGLAIVSADNTNGVWQFSVDAGQTWEPFGSISLTQALLLDDSADSLVRFVPNLNFAGNATFAFRAWDQTGGSPQIANPDANGTNADTTTSGGTSAFSSAIGTAQIAVVSALPALDAFTQNNGTPLGAIWTQQVGNYSILNNQANSAASLNLATINSAAVANVVVQADLTLPNGVNSQVGLVARYFGTGDSANMYWGALFRIGSTTFATIYRHNTTGNSWTGLAAAPVAGNPLSGKLRFEVIDNSLQLFLNGALVASTVDNSAQALTGPGTVGMRSLMNTQLDNFSGKAVFTDTFTQGNASPLNPASWSTQSGQFAIANNAAASGNGTNLATLNGYNEADVRLEADVALAPGGVIGLAARSIGADFYTGVLLDSGGITYAAIVRHAAAGFSVLSSINVVAGNPKSGKLRFDVTGTSLSLSLNGAAIASVTDAALTIGSAGIASIGGGAFDNFRATPRS